MNLELEQHLIDMGIIPPTPLAELSAMLAPKGLCEEIGQVSNTREERLAYFAALPTTDEHGEYLF